jgi:hypothetical protein
MIRIQGSASEIDDILKMLRTICPEAEFDINPEDNTVKVGKAPVCRDPPNGCCRCICHLISFERTVTINIRLNLAAAPWLGGRTTPANWDDGVRRDGERGPGTDSEVEVESRDRWNAARETDPTDFVPDPDWAILAHELCGHALPLMRGDHPEPREDHAGYRPDNHRQAEAMHNACREAHGLPRIDVTARTPF